MQLEVSSIATDFEYRLFKQELALCQRYYEKSYNYDIAPGTSFWTTGALSDYFSGQILISQLYLTANGNRKHIVLAFVVEKGNVPTMAYYDGAGNITKVTTFDVNSAWVASNIFETYQAITSNKKGLLMQSAANCCGFACMWTASAEL